MLIVLVCVNGHLFMVLTALKDYILNSLMYPTQPRQLCYSTPSLYPFSMKGIHVVAISHFSHLYLTYSFLSAICFLVFMHSQIQHFSVLQLSQVRLRSLIELRVYRDNKYTEY